MIDERIIFEERYDSKEDGSTTLYFKAPKDLFPSVCDDETVSVTISLEFPTAQMEAAYAGCAISPTDASGSDYDWNDYDFPYEEISELMALADAHDKESSLKSYFVTYKVEARYIAEIKANNLKEALEKADSVYTEADFGEACDINGEAIIVEDDNGNYVWEK